MIFLKGGSFVNDGLVLYLDAGNQGSYPGTGTNWTDLAKGNNATLESMSYSSLGGGSFSISTSNGAALLGSPSDLDFASGDFSIESWFYSTSTGGSNSLLSKGRGNLRIVIGDPTKFEISNDAGSYTSNAMGLTISVNVWTHFVIRRLGGVVACFVDTVKGTEYTIGTDITNNQANDWELANTPDVGFSQYLFGSMAICRMYNRGLSDKEITINFEANRNRFGI